MEDEKGEDVLPSAYLMEPVRPTEGNPVDLLQTLAARVDDVVQKLGDTKADGCEEEVLEIQKMAAEMGQDRFIAAMQQHVGNMFESKKAAIVVPTGGEPLKMWEPSFWVKQFPDLFPYGDGAYGLGRRRQMGLQQWGLMMLTRTELEYAPPVDVPKKCPAEPPCRACSVEKKVPKRRQPRWSAHVSFRFVLYDCWRRAEIMRKARMHVRKKGFQQNLKLIAGTSAEHLRHAMSILGQASSMHQVASDDRIELSLRRALKEKPPKICFGCWGDIIGD